MTDGFIFNMGYTVNFENATAVYDSAQSKPLTLFEKGKDAVQVEVDEIMGYNLEIDYLVDCILNGNRPTVVTWRTRCRRYASSKQKLKVCKPAHESRSDCDGLCLTRFFLATTFGKATSGIMTTHLIRSILIRCPSLVTIKSVGCRLSRL